MEVKPAEMLDVMHTCCYQLKRKKNSIFSSIFPIIKALMTPDFF